MGLSADWAQFPHLSQHQREVAENMAHLGDQPPANLYYHQSNMSLKPGQFDEFVFGHRMSTSEARSHEVEASIISKTHDEFIRDQDWNEEINSAVEMLMTRIFLQVLL